MAALFTVDPGNKDMKAIVGKTILFGGIAFLMYWLYKNSAALVEFGENMYYLAGMIIGGCLIAYWLSSGGWRALKYLVYGFAQFTLGWAIEMNAFNILQMRLDETAKDTEDLMKYKTELEGKKAELDEKIETADKELKVADNAVRILKAKRTLTDNEQDNLEINLQTIQSNTEYINGMMPLINDIIRLLDFLQRAYRSATIGLKKSKKDLQMKRDLYETVTTSSKMVGKAWKALMGREDTASDAEKAIEFLRKDIGAKIGAIKTGLKVTGQYMDGKDLENAAKLKTTLEQLQNVDLQQVEYSSTVTDGATKIELGNLKGSNVYNDFLLIDKKSNTDNTNNKTFK